MSAYTGGKLTPEKRNELWHDYGKVFKKIREACEKTKSASCRSSWKNKREQKVIILDIIGVMSEDKLRMWSAWITALLKGEHFTSKKGYAYRDGVLRYFITPDWEYYGLVMTNKNYILPDPKNVIGVDSFDIEKEMKTLLRGVTNAR